MCPLNSMSLLLALFLAPAPTSGSSINNKLQHDDIRTSKQTAIRVCPSATTQENNVS